MLRSSAMFGGASSSPGVFGAGMGRAGDILKATKPALIAALENTSRWAKSNKLSVFLGTIVAIFGCMNLKRLPLVWHARVFYNSWFPRKNYFQVDTPGAIFRPVVTPSRVSLLETDYNLHKSESTYFSDLDVARMDLLAAIKAQALAGGLGNDYNNRKVHTLLAGTSCTFKREMRSGVAFDMYSRIMSWDRKYIYVVTHFVERTKGSPAYGTVLEYKPFQQRVVGSPRSAQTVYATAIAKVVVRAGYLTVPPDDFFRFAGLLPADNTDMESALGGGYAISSISSVMETGEKASKERKEKEKERRERKERKERERKERKEQEAAKEKERQERKERERKERKEREREERKREERKEKERQERKEQERVERKERERQERKEKEREEREKEDADDGKSTISTSTRRSDKGHRSKRDKKETEEERRIRKEKEREERRHHEEAADNKSTISLSSSRRGKETEEERRIRKERERAERKERERLEAAADDDKSTISTSTRKKETEEERKVRKHREREERKERERKEIEREKEEKEKARAERKEREREEARKAKEAEEYEAELAAEEAEEAAEAAAAAAAEAARKETALDKISKKHAEALATPPGSPPPKAPAGSPRQPAGEAMMQWLAGIDGWTWERVEEERVRALEIALGVAGGMDTAHDEYQDYA